MDGVSFDEYGFVIPEQESTDDGSSLDDSEKCHDYSPQPSKDVLDSWQAVLDSWDQHYKDSPQRLRQLLRKGVPHSLRSKVWQVFLNSNTLKAQSSFNYQASLSELQTQLQSHGISEYSTDHDVRELNSLIEIPSTSSRVGVLTDTKTHSSGHSKTSTWARTVRQIMMDVNRTFPQHRLFLGDEAPGKRTLLRVLVLYTEYNTKVGYCQGMAYVGGLLLMSMEEEDTFWALVSLFDRPKYLSGYYNHSMDRIQTHAEVFGLMLKDKLPKLAAHLEELGIHPLLYVTSWFLCLFTTLPCWDSVLAICDILFLEGTNAIFRAALAVMKVCAPELMAMYQMGEVVHFLQHLPSRLVSHSNLLRVIRRTPIQNWEVELYVDIVHGTKERLESGVEECDGQSRKRAAPTDNETGHTPRASKRRKKESQTPASSRSLLSRIKSVLTPARLSKSALPSTIQSGQDKHKPSSDNTCSSSLAHNTNATSHTMTDKEASTPSFRMPSVRPSRKRRRDSDEGVLTIDSCNFQDCDTENIELKDFSTAKKIYLLQNFSAGLSKTFISPVQRLTPFTSPLVTSGTKTGVSPLPFSLGDVSSDRVSQGRRRSVRIAKRRSVSRGGVTQGALPSLSVLSPMSVRPLQEHVQTTNHPREHHAFRMFTTPTPMRAHSQAKRDSCALTPEVAKVLTPIAMDTPEVELKPF